MLCMSIPIETVANADHVECCVILSHSVQVQTLESAIAVEDVRVFVWKNLVHAVNGSAVVV
jgi:hypothetical protein